MPDTTDTTAALDPICDAVANDTTPNVVRCPAGHITIVRRTRELDREEWGEWEVQKFSPPPDCDGCLAITDPPDLPVRIAPELFAALLAGLLTGSLLLPHGRHIVTMEATAVNGGQIDVAVTVHRFTADDTRLRCELRIGALTPADDVAAEAAGDA